MNPSFLAFRQKLLRPDLNGALFYGKLSLPKITVKKAGMEGINKIEANALIEVYERSSVCPNN